MCFENEDLIDEDFTGDYDRNGSLIWYRKISLFANLVGKCYTAKIHDWFT